MKKQLLTVTLLMGTFVASAQVGVGTLDPNKSAQLDVVAEDKGILIPRVQLTSVTDTTTITNGNVESLLVFNLTSNEDLKHGYYYWFEGEWRRLIASNDNQTDVLTILSYNQATNTLNYIDENGVSHDFVLNNTKNSTIVLNGTVLTITDTEGNTFPVDLAGLDTNTTNVSLVLDDENQLKLTDSANQVLIADLSALAVDENTTITNVTLNPTNNHLTIVNSDGEEIFVDLTLLLDDTNTKITDINFSDTYILTITDSDGDTKNVDLSSLVNTTKLQAGTNVTITGDGSVLTPYIISSKNTVIESITFDSTTSIVTIVDSDKTLNLDLSELTKNTTITNVNFDSSTNFITIVDSDSSTTNVDISGVLKAKNGLKVVDKHVILGGDLTENTTINTLDYDLAIQNLQQTDTSENSKIMIVENTTGKLKVADFPQILNENLAVGLTSDSNTMTVDVNGQTATAPIINSIAMSTDSTTLTTIVNGEYATVDLKNAIQTGQKTTTVVDGLNTSVTNTTIGDNTEYKVDVAIATASNLGVVKQAATNATVFINTAGELSTSAAALNNIIEVTTDYSLVLNDVVVFGDAATDITITIPNPVGIKGRKVTIKKSDAENTTYVNVVSAGGATIEGEPDLYTSLPYTGWDLMSDGTTWKIVNKF